MKSQIIIEVETDSKDENVSMSIARFIPNSSSEKHKEAVEKMYNKFSKTIDRWLE